MDVTLLLDNPEVAFRGPWDRSNLVKVGPVAGDLATGRFGYHLDLPGNALNPGCDYERWSKRTMRGSVPTTYARVATEPDAPGQVALQYWFFYAFNDYNNKHEGDWEMIQLVFDADDAAAALATTPARIGYSQHEGAEVAAWDDPKLEIVETGDGKHPVVYPAAGSHANYFEAALYLGRGAAEGVGCDDSTGPSREVAPRVEMVPSEAQAARDAYPWLGYEGHWGERNVAFYNGPTGPNTKPQWDAPIRWANTAWRPQSYAVVGGSLLGPGATSFFCGAIGDGSDLLRRLTWSPGPVALALLALTAVVAWLATRTRWTGSAPFRLARRRTIGQLLVDAARAYARRPLLFLGIGLVFVPLALIASALQAAVLQLTATDIAIGTAGESQTLLVLVAAAVAAVFGLVALVLVQAACTRALRDLDAGAGASVRGAYRSALAAAPALLGALAPASLAIAALAATTFGLPVALWLLVRTALFPQAVALERHGAWTALRRSTALVRGRFFRAAAVLVAAATVPLTLGPVIGVVGLLVAHIPLAVANVISSLVYAMAIPYLAIAATYLYFDLDVRSRLEPRERRRPEMLPEER